MIAVVGEALIDLVIDPAGSVTAALGGAPFNTARACGRLGVDVSFRGAISRDRFGTQLFDRLVADSVDVSSVPRVDLPTTLAAAELDERGAASYRFYIEGTSAPALPSPPSLDGVDVVFTGGLGLVLEPMATSVEEMVAAASDAAASGRTAPLVVVDVNCRPLIIPDRESYLARVERVAAMAAVVKVSDEDLDYLSPGVDAGDAARSLLDRGTSVVLVTGGAAGVRVVTEAGERFVPVEPVVVVDTIGAGDTFGGAFMTWLLANDVGPDRLGDADLMARAVAAANTAAGIACTRRGAEPPYRAELPADWDA